jgi:hypothetical protein
LSLLGAVTALDKHKCAGLRRPRRECGVERLNPPSEGLVMPGTGEREKPFSTCLWLGHRDQRLEDVPLPVTGRRHFDDNGLTTVGECRRGRDSTVTLGFGSAPAGTVMAGPRTAAPATSTPSRAVRR